MLKKWTIAVLLCATASLTACKDKGEAFIGTWHWKQAETGTEKNVVIRKEGDIYHIDVSEKMPFFEDKTFKPTMSMEGKLESDDVMSVIGLRNFPTLRVENGKLIFTNKTYDKVPDSQH